MPAVAQDRVALVIGNSRYVNETPLRNPRADADDISKALETAGFQVSVHYDLGKSPLETALGDFLLKSEDAQIALIYYAGHGIEVGGKNYFIPVDANLTREKQVNFQATAFDLALLAASGASKLAVVVVDACRDNPYRTRMILAEGTRTSVGRGLGRSDPPSDNMIYRYRLDRKSVV